MKEEYRHVVSVGYTKFAFQNIEEAVKFYEMASESEPVSLKYINDTPYITKDDCCEITLSMKKYIPQEQ